MANGRLLRGQRVFCSNRGRHGGCGRTFSIFLAPVLPRHSFTAVILWRLLAMMLANPCVKRAAESLRLPFALESIYHLLLRLRRRLDVLRCCLFGRQKPSDSAQSDPLLQSVEHLRSVFAGSLCPLSDFQLVFQQPVLG